jgi:hypothetical protein
MSRVGNRFRADCRRFQPGLPDRGGGFFAAGGASRSRWANFFSRCAFSRENDASPRASRAGGSPEESAVAATSGATSSSARATGAGASGEAAGSARNGTASTIGASAPRAAGIAVGPGVPLASTGGGIGASRGVAAGRGKSGWSPPEGPSGRGGSAADVPSARFRLCQSPGFRREEESSEGSTSRGCGRPKRRSGATS